MDHTATSRTRWTAAVAAALALHTVAEAVWTLRLADRVPAADRGLSLVTGAAGAVALAVLAVMTARGRGHGIAGALEIATLLSGWQWADRFPDIRVETTISMVLAVVVLAMLAGHGRATRASEAPASAPSAVAGRP